MPNIPHAVQEDFPTQIEKIRALKMSNAHFAKLLAEYAAVNADVHKAETLEHPVEQLAEVDLRKHRAHLKDKIAHMLAQA